MSAELLSRPAAPSPAPPPRYPVLTALLVLIGVGTSIVASFGALAGDKILIVLPLALVLGGGLALLALTRFAVFVLVLLVVRSALDVIRLSGASAGNTATNAAAVKGLDPSSLVGILFLLTAALWLAAQLRRGTLLRGTRLRTALLAFLASSALSVFGSANLQSSFLELLRLAAVVFMYIVLEQLMVDPRWRGRLLAACFAACVIPVAFTLIGVLTGHAIGQDRGGFARVSGTFSQPNDFGRFLMVMIIFGAGLLPYLQKRLRILLGLLLAGCVVCMVLTLTITAVGGTVIGLVVVGLIQSRKLLAGLAIAMVASVIFVPSLTSRITSATDVSSVQTVGNSSNSSLAWRFAYWADVLPLADHNPVTGIGLNQTQYQTDAEKQPHNDFLRAYVETGIIGFVTYVAMLIGFLGLGRRAWSATVPGTVDRGIAAGFWGVAVAFVVVSIAANVISNVVLLWYVVAFAAAASSTLPGRSRLDAELAALSPARPAP